MNSMASKNASIDRAMEEGADQSKSEIGTFIKGHKMAGQFGMDFIPVEGICVNVFFSRSSDSIVYTLQDKEGKKHNIHSFCITSRK